MVLYVYKHHTSWEDNFRGSWSYVFNKLLYEHLLN